MLPFPLDPCQDEKGHLRAGAGMTWASPVNEPCHLTRGPRDPIE